MFATSPLKEASVESNKDPDLIRSKIKYFSNFVWNCDECSWHRRFFGRRKADRCHNRPTFKVARINEKIRCQFVWKGKDFNLHLSIHFTLKFLAPSDPPADEEFCNRPAYCPENWLPPIPLVPCIGIHLWYRTKHRVFS